MGANCKHLGFSFISVFFVPFVVEKFCGYKKFNTAAAIKNGLESRPFFADGLGLNPISQILRFTQIIGWSHGFEAGFFCFWQGQTINKHMEHFFAHAAFTAGEFF